MTLTVQVEFRVMRPRIDDDMQRKRWGARRRPHSEPSVPHPCRCRLEVGMALLAVALAARPSEAWGADATQSEDFQGAQENTREIRHTVAARLSAPDVVTFTVIREFEARRPEVP